jgi:hypothetical protein
MFGTLNDGDGVIVGVFVGVIDGVGANNVQIVVAV